jgi:hypothetical protein
MEVSFTMNEILKRSLKAQGDEAQRTPQHPLQNIELPPSSSDEDLCDKCRKVLTGLAVSRVGRRTDRDHLELVKNFKGDAVLRQKPLTVEPRAVRGQTSGADPKGDALLMEGIGKTGVSIGKYIMSGVEAIEKRLE